mgnify:CR=1 FL=1
MEDGGGKLLCQTSLHSKEHVGCRMEEDSLQGHVDGADDDDKDDDTATVHNVLIHFCFWSRVSSLSKASNQSSGISSSASYGPISSDMPACHSFVMGSFCNP